MDQASIERARMQDFGESLVDIRDRLSVPLPLRVQRVRLFILSFTETFCTLFIRLLSRRYQFVQSRLPRGDSGINDVRDAFAGLKDMHATVDQINQANELFMQEMGRRMARATFELDTCVRIVRAAMFGGIAVYMDILCAATMSALLGQSTMAFALLLGLMILQLLGTLICLNGFVQCQLLR